jgi:hypothetical protein
LNELNNFQTSNLRIKNSVNKIISIVTKLKLNFASNKNMIIGRDEAGHVIDLNRGHTKEFSAKEEIRLNAHLLNAKFGDAETSNFLNGIALDESRLLMRE